MPFLRWTVITALLLGLPTWAVLGDVQQVARFWRDSPEAQEGRLASELTHPILDPSDLESPNVQVATRMKGQNELPAVFPELRGHEDQSGEPNGKSLRPAIYRPLAQPNRSSSYVRVPANDGNQDPAFTPSIRELESELRAMGPQRYRMAEVNGTYVFTCEFAPRTPGESQMTFKSESSSSEAAMQDAIAQAQAWQRNLR